MGTQELFFLTAPAASAAISSIITWFVARKKNDAQVRKADAEAALLELKGVHQVIDIYKQQASDLSKHVDELSSEVSRCTDENHDLQGKMGELIDENEQLKYKMGELIKENARVTESNRDLITQVSVLTKEIQVLREVINNKV